MNRIPHIVAFGGGVNCTAMIIELINLKKPIDLILFADTGGEHQYTYDHITLFNTWLEKHNAPTITIVKKVRKDGSKETLEEECLRRKVLPSIAYGFKSCSEKHKVQPQQKFLNHWKETITCWKAGLKAVQYIGFDAGESHRIKKTITRNRQELKYDYEYPLIDWNWDREECLKAIINAGLTPPKKSSCFFCPSTRKQEVINLSKEDPKLFKRALQIEKNAENLTTIKGLGRRHSWEEMVLLDTNKEELPLIGFELPCDCIDD